MPNMDDRAIADTEIEYDTDIMVLDYLCTKSIYQALVERVAEIKGQQAGQESNEYILLFDTWKNLTSTKHADKPVSRDMEIKLQLLTFELRFIYRNRQSTWERSSPELSRWRVENSKHTRAWIDQPIPPETLDANYRKLLEDLRIPAQQCIPDRKKIMSLLDILPEFIALCTIAGHLRSPQESQELILLFMVQTVLEQYHLGGRTTEAIDEAFSWHPSQNEINISETGNACNWERMRARYIDIFLPDNGQSIQTTIEKLSGRFQALEFEALIIDYLQRLLAALETPTLVELETAGLLDAPGLSLSET